MVLNDIELINGRVGLILVPNDVELNNGQVELILVPYYVEFLLVFNTMTNILVFSHFQHSVIGLQLTKELQTFFSIFCGNVSYVLQL